MKRVLLIDGDVLVYKTAFASETITEWGNGIVTLHSNIDEAADNIDGQIAAIQERLDGEVVVALTCHNTPNFRKEVYPQYKANRTEKRKPIVWKAMRDHLFNQWNAKLKDNLEADDVLGILATMASNDERIIVSIDKDFKTVPCAFFNLNSGELLEVSEDEANYNFLVQTLTGDATDNYPGCPGIGKKRASLLLDDALKAAEADVSNGRSKLAVMWEAVVKRFAQAGFGEEYALTQARCARILRASDYDFANKKPILWEAPK